jgi:hypothetical protein
MSQETPIGSLNNVSDEDSKLVESILNDLNNDQSSSPQGPSSGQSQGGEQMTPEQMKAIQMQRQMAMQQQQQQNLMAQQQQLQQQRMNQQKMPTENTTPNGGDNLIENIKKEAKSILLVIFLSLLFNLEQVDNIFKMSPSLFLNEAGTINIQGVLSKAILIGLSYYLIKTYLL